MDDRTRGFTLLEMVISLTIIAALAGIIAVSLRLTSGSIDRGDEETREAARMRAGIGLVERALRSADPAPLAAEGKPYFLGERTRVRFLTASAPAALALGSFRLLCFLQAEGPNGGGLALADASPFRAEGTEVWDVSESSRVFLPGAREISFYYSPGPSPEGAWEWREAWDGHEEGRLPAAVRIEFFASSDGGDAVTAFVVPVPAGG